MPKITVSSATLPCCSDSSAARRRSVAKVIRAPFGFASWCSARSVYRSGPDLSETPREPLRTRELGQPHRAAGMQLLRGDANLRTEAEFAAVGEASRRV